MPTENRLSCESIASEWIKDTNGYKTAMNERKVKQSKRSRVIIFFKTLVIKIKGNTYSVRKIKVSWTELKTVTYLKSIVLCLLRGSN